MLLYEGETFQTPDDFVFNLTLTSQIVHQRIGINPDSPLGNILNQAFDNKYSLYCPPEYPPLLVHIAIANQDYVVAAKTFEHPIFIGDSSKPNLALTHVLHETVGNAILDDHLEFLWFLFEEYVS